MTRPCLRCEIVAGRCPVAAVRPAPIHARDHRAGPDELAGVDAAADAIRAAMRDA